MLNMIKFDWIGMKYYHLRIIIMPLLICFIGLFSEALILPFLAYFMLSFSVNPFAVEEKGKLDNLYLTLPVTRKAIVNARFGLSLIMQLVGIVFGMVMTFLMSSLLYGKTVMHITHSFFPNFDFMLLTVCSSLFLYAVMNLCMFPILFKLGYAKGKALGFYIPVIVFSMILSGAFVIAQGSSEKFMTAAAWLFENPYSVSAILVSLAVVFFAVSIALSQKLYAKREF